MKNYTWKDLEKIYKKALHTYHWSDSKIATEIAKVPKEYQLGLAIAFSIIKWNPKSDTCGQGPCGLCVLTSKEFEEGEWTEEECKGCPLKIKGKTCNDDNSLFANADDEIWHKRYCHEFDKPFKSKGKIEKLYNKLVEIYTKEWEKI